MFRVHAEADRRGGGQDMINRSTHEAGDQLAEHYRSLLTAFETCTVLLDTLYYNYRLRRYTLYTVRETDTRTSTASSLACAQSCFLGRSPSLSLPLSLSRSTYSILRATEVSSEPQRRYQEGGRLSTLDASAACTASFAQLPSPRRWRGCHTMRVPRAQEMRRCRAPRPARRIPRRRPRCSRG